MVCEHESLMSPLWIWVSQSVKLGSLCPSIHLQWISKSISGGRNLGWGARQEVGLDRWGGVEWEAGIWTVQPHWRATWQDFINWGSRCPTTPQFCRKILTPVHKDMPGVLMVVWCVEREQRKQWNQAQAQQSGQELTQCWVRREETGQVLSSDLFNGD